MVEIKLFSIKLSPATLILGVIQDFLRLKLNIQVNLERRERIYFLGHTLRIHEFDFFSREEIFPFPLLRLTSIINLSILISTPKSVL